MNDIRILKGILRVIFGTLFLLPLSRIIFINKDYSKLALISFGCFGIIVIIGIIDINIGVIKNDK